MKIELRKLFRIIHRDLGYLFFGMTIIYALSGIGMNHINEWNPNYIIKRKDIKVKMPVHKETLNKSEVLEILGSIGEKKHFKNYYFPEENTIKIFIKYGSVKINTKTGKGVIETSRRRPIFNQITFLHYNPGKLWTYFSDIFAVSLIIIAITGLFIIKGKKGITGRGIWLTAIGIIIPIIILFIYL